MRIFKFIAGFRSLLLLTLLMLILHVGAKSASKNPRIVAVTPAALDYLNYCGLKKFVSYAQLKLPYDWEKIYASGDYIVYVDGAVKIPERIKKRILIPLKQDKIADVYSNLKLLKLYFSEYVADSIVKGWLKNYLMVRRQVMGIGKNKKALIVIWQDPIYVAGVSTFLDDVCELCGFENAFSNSGWRRISFEEALRLKPDVVLYLGEGAPDKRWSYVGKVLTFSEEIVKGLTRPGPYILRWIKEFATEVKGQL